KRCRAAATVFRSTRPTLRQRRCSRTSRRLPAVLFRPERGVVSAEAEGIVYGDADLLLFRDIRGVIEVAFRIRIFEIDRWWDNAVADRERTGCSLNGASAA